MNETHQTRYPNMAANSAEYKTLLHHTEALSLSVKPDLVSLSQALQAATLIGSDDGAYMRNQIHGERLRAATLVERIQNRVLQNPANYHVFIGVLGRDENQYGYILQQLQSTYRSFSGEFIRIDITVDSG